jgi:hypothetical protein
MDGSTNHVVISRRCLRAAMTVCAMPAFSATATLLVRRASTCGLCPDTVHRMYYLEVLQVQANNGFAHAEPHPA